MYKLSDLILIIILSFSQLCFGVIPIMTPSNLFAYDDNNNYLDRPVIALPFILNKGQLDEEILFYSQVIGGMVVITDKGEIVYSFDSKSEDKSGTSVIFTEVFIGGQKHSAEGLDRAVTKVNCFKGTDSSRWTTNIPTYESIDMGEIYKGIKVKLKASGNNVEKVFIVDSGADPNTICMKLNGVKHLGVSKTGELEIFGPTGTFSFTKPVAYQEINKNKQYVNISYEINHDEYRFLVGDYDKNYPLIIDPLLKSTYYGGSGKDGILEVPMVMDADGNIYVASRTQSYLDLPLIIPGAYQENFGGGNDIFIAKFNNDLSVLLAATYLGGSGAEGLWQGSDLRIDSDGNIIVAGRTNSLNYPHTLGVLYTERVGGYDAFISKLSPELDDLLASTYFGGSDNEYYIKLATTDNGDNYLSGTTASDDDFPITVLSACYPDFAGMGGGPYPGDIFVAKISGDLTTLYACTYLGGASYEYNEELLIDESGNIFLAGWTGSSDFPTSVGAFDRSYAGGYYDAFVTCLDGDLTTLIASTFLGGSEWDFGYSMTLSETGDVYVAGHTASSHTSPIRFPTTTGAYQETYQGGGSNTDDAFIARFNHDLTSLLACTYYGGSGFENGTSIKIGEDEKVYLGGATTSPNLETFKNTFDPDYAGGSLYSGDAFVAVFNNNLSEHTAFSYIGGSGSECLGSMLIDNSGDIYISGSTNSDNFPTTDNTYQSDYAGGSTGLWLNEDDWGGDIYISKLNFDQFTRITEGPHVNDGGYSMGVNWIDYDNDGYQDIYIINCLLPGGQNNCLYRNLGDGSFTKIEGLEIVNDCACGESASWADYDNDGDLDMALANFVTFGSALYINNGSGQFTKDVTSPLENKFEGSTSANWVDYDLDGDVDLMVSNSTGVDPYTYLPFSNFLFSNDEFTLTEVAAGQLTSLERHTYGTSWSDFDNDGDPDLIAPNGQGENDELYQNDGEGSFSLLSSSIVGNDGADTYGSSSADYDNDGDMDLFIGNFGGGESFLYQNVGDGTFTKVLSHGLGLTSGNSFAGVWADYDNDGDEDIFVWYVDVGDFNASRGHLFENLGGGLFGEVTDGSIAKDTCIAGSAAWGDYDNDGDMDLFVARYRQGQDNTDNLLYENNGNSNSWITIKCIGTIANKSAIGARVYLKATIDGSPVWQIREISSQTGARAQNQLDAHFGLGDTEIIDSIKVEWPGGQITDILTDVPVNQFLTITESICGDIDGAPGVDILDIVYLINYKYKSGPTPIPLYAANVNSDNNIDILDIVYLINFKYKDGPAPVCL